MALTDEQKAELKKKGEEYRRLRYDIKEQISKLEIQKSKLEEELMDSMPKTPNGRMFCKSCYVLSMPYIGKIPREGLSGGEEIYKCEICGHEEIRDIF